MAEIQLTVSSNICTEQLYVMAKFIGFLACSVVSYENISVSNE